MATLSLTDSPISKLAVDALVIGLAKDDGDGIALVSDPARALDKAMKGRLLPALAELGATGAEGEVVKLATLGTAPARVVVAAGLGSPTANGARYPTETIRRAAGNAVRALAGTGEVAVAVGLVNDAAPADLRAAAEGALLAAYRFDRYRGEAADAGKPPVPAVALVVPRAKDKEAKEVARQVQVLAEAVHLSRDLVNTAPNDLHPAELAAAAVSAAKRVGLDVEVFDERDLRNGGYGGILAVGTGSAHPPRLVHLAYRARRASRTVALVGKGITFDSGGLSLKPAASMTTMKTDMAGAAAVIAAMTAIAQLKPRVDVDAWVPMAENMPSGSAYRPGDIVTMYGGTTVEVLNTDAEGRMVLGDAIARACEDEPDYLLEASTLTGGQVTALGHRVIGLMGEETLRERVQRVGERTGEPLWAMPLPDDVRKGMQSPVADLSQVNAGMDRAGHMLQGGVFLSRFVADDVAWAHLDIAGPAYHSGDPYGYISKGGTGVPVRTLVEVVEDIALNG